MEWGSNDGAEENQEAGSEGEIEIQNQFYEAEGMMKQQPADSLEKFETVIMMEEGRDEQQFSFSALKYVTVLSSHLGQFDKMIESTQKLLKQSQKVSKNDIAEAVNAVLDCVSTNLAEKPEYARKMYQLILGSLKTTNERLWFATSLRLGKIYLDEKNFEPLNDLLVELKHACRTPEAQSVGGSDFNDFNQYDVSKSNLLLEAFSLEIQMCIETREQRRMKEIFQTTKKFSVVIEDPRVVGIIKECGGKIYMTEKRWQAAEQEFVESFKSLLDVGSSKA